jgi:hypothetical protein
MFAWFTAAMAATLGYLVTPTSSMSSMVDLSISDGLNDNKTFDEVESNLMIDEGCPNF